MSLKSANDTSHMQKSHYDIIYEENPYIIIMLVSFIRK
jgi:hypothetical protein